MTEYVRVPKDWVCKVPKCGRPKHKKGYCNRHYLRLLRYGNPLAGSPNRHRVVRWLKENSFHRRDECLLWPFYISDTGYGECADYLGIGRGAHRNMCYLVHGKPPNRKYEAAHSCGNRACCAPKHLSWKTASANRLDKIAHGTHTRGERNPKAKLTVENVRYIRKMKGRITGRALAVRFGVTPALISNIYRGKCWGWLD